MTPEQAAGFYEDDEDPQEVFTWFDASPPDGVTEPPEPAVLNPGLTGGWPA